MSHRQEADAIVAEWREVHRDIARALPASPEYVRLYREARRLREEYQSLIEAAWANLRPEHPPFPRS